MYANVHMPNTIPITDFRQNIFDYTTQILANDQEVEIERNGQRILRVVPIKDNPAERAKYILKYVLPQLAGTWKNEPKRNLAWDKREIAYIKKTKKGWSK